MKTKGTWFIKLALRISGNRLLKELRKKSKSVDKTQHDVLMAIIDYAKNTEYGQKHKFSTIKSIRDFQHLVPINTYDDLKGSIDKHMKGQENVLFPGKPILYATTSGTTKEPKWIPITKKYFNECYKKMSLLWMFSLAKENKAIFDFPALSIVGRPIEGYMEDGTPYGSCSGFVYDNIPRFLIKVHAVPSIVNYIKDYDAKYYTLLRFSIAGPLKQIITGNPSTLLELNNFVQKYLPLLIEDIALGRLSNRFTIEPDIRSKLERKLSPNKARADFLQTLSDSYESVLPKHYWPELDVIVTWKCGNSGLYLKHSKDFYPEHTVIREFGYFATEARAGIILTNNEIASIMGGQFFFLEFIKVAEIANENPSVYLLSELELNEKYYILLTTSSGLYRYNINDILRVDGFYNQFPKMTFLQKGAGVTSLTGEKLTELQFIEAVHHTERLTGIQVVFFVGFADFEATCYQVFIEFLSQVTEADIQLFTEKLDCFLCQYNIEYQAKRASFRLNSLNVFPLIKNAFSHYKYKCMQQGERDGQFKMMHLQQNEQRMTMFYQLLMKERVSS